MENKEDQNEATPLTAVEMQRGVISPADKCPHCEKEMSLFVSISLKMPGRFENNITKASLKRKDCQIMAANWDKASLTCYDCGYRVKGL